MINRGAPEWGLGLWGGGLEGQFPAGSDLSPRPFHSSALLSLPCVQFMVALWRNVWLNRVSLSHGAGPCDGLPRRKEGGVSWVRELGHI